MGGRKQRQTRFENAKYSQEKQMVENIDDRAAFEEFKQKFVPELRKMLLSGKSDVEILKKFKNFGAARLVEIIVQGGDMQALSAIRELFDRIDGRAPTKTENVHKFQKLPDAELDAIVKSKLAGLEAIENRSDDDEESE